MKLKLSNSTKRLLIKGAYTMASSGSCCGCPIQYSADAIRGFELLGYSSQYSRNPCVILRANLNSCTCSEIAGYMIAKMIEKDLEL